MNLLEVQGLRKHFGGIKAVDGADLHVKEGTITGLIGPNGAGKTTTFDLITGFQQPDSGTVHFDGQRIDRLPPHRLARMGVGRTFQLVRLLPRMSATDNLVIAARDHPGETLAGAVFGGWQDKESEEMEAAAKALEYVGMSHRGDVPAGQLSYGQSKLTEIARVLSLDARLMLLDEPMSGINPTLRKRILETVRGLRDEGKTFLIIEHDIEMIMAECDDIIVMHQGKVLVQGPPDVIQADERVAEAYLGGTHA